jgi:hypothetical protein
MHYIPGRQKSLKKSGEFPMSRDPFPVPGTAGLPVKQVQKNKKQQAQIATLKRSVLESNP